MRKSKLVHFLSLANRNPRIGAMCLGFVACLIGSPMVFFAVSDMRFLLDGQSVDARIVGPPAIVQRKFAKRYRFRFAYTDASGQKHFGDDIRRVADVESGDTICVRYLRGDPATSRAENDVRSVWPRVFTMIVFSVLVGSFWTGITGVRGVLKQMSANMTEVPSAANHL